MAVELNPEFQKFSDASKFVFDGARKLLRSGVLHDRQRFAHVKSSDGWDWFHMKSRSSDEWHNVRVNMGLEIGHCDCLARTYCAHLHCARCFLSGALWEQTLGFEVNKA